MVRFLIPPAAVYALRSPETFAKIETEAAHRLKGPARRLYAVLADKKRLGRPSWTFGLEELRILLAVNDRPSYDRWQSLKRWVLAPAVEAINEFGTVEVAMSPIKEGRSVSGVRFSWRWKSPDMARETEEENTRHSKARRKVQAVDDAPPMIEDEPQQDEALDWWGRLTSTERDTWADRVGRTFQAGGGTFTRREADVARAAYAEATERPST
jgi:plasmid replication initiation protein